MSIMRRFGVPADWSARIVSASPKSAKKLILGSFLALVIADGCSPWYITFGTFYLVLIAYTSWVFDRRSGWAIASLSILVSIAINGFSGFVTLAHGPARYVAIGWSLAMRIMSSGAVVELVRSFRRSFNHERQAGDTDSLTGIPNRRAFMSALISGLSRARAAGGIGVVAYIDLDGFKPINDRYGHAAGDDVLMRFAALLAMSIRVTDCVGRVGGDEFALFFEVPNVSIAHRASLGLQRRLDEGLKAMPYEGLSCSIGAVIVPENIEEAGDSLLKRADELMFEAKAGNFMRIALLDRPQSQPATTVADTRARHVW